MLCEKGLGQLSSNEREEFMDATQNKTSNRFELREPLRSFLKSLRDFSGSDACALYLIEDDMDDKEKFDNLEKRYRGTKEAKETKFKILKFIGVADDKPNGDAFWKFDYDRRPDKYVVFTERAKEEFIAGEGITGMTARRGQCFHFTESQIEQHPARSGNREVRQDDTARRIHAKCKSLVTIPIFNDDKIFGVIRFDLYEKDTFARSFLEYIKKECKKARTPFFLNSITHLLINQSTLEAKDKSYRKLYKGTSLLDSLKTLSESSKIDKDSREILELVTHLFYVFQRHTYIGHDEIMKRVLYFTSDLGTKLSLTLPFSELLDKFKDQEKLMLYDIDNYRDHFMHQFHVFVLGFVIINQIGVDYFVDKLNSRRTQISGFKDTDKLIDQKCVFRMWAIIAFFHDICYLFQEYKTGIEHFIKEILKKDVSVSFDWSNTLSDQSGGSNYSAHLEKMSRFFVSLQGETNNHKLLTNYYEAILRHQDHGVFSALYALDYLLSINKTSSTAWEFEAYLSALSISMHNSCVFSGLGEGEEFEISFEAFPLEFLLVYCDTLAEWGRDKKIEGSSRKCPKLESFIFDQRKKEFIGVLNYDEWPHVTRQFIDDKIKKIKHVFKSSDYKFRIRCKVSGDKDLVENFSR